PGAVTGWTRDRLAHQAGAFSNWGGPTPTTFDVEEFAAAFVRFENGATLVLEVSWLLHHKTTGEDMQMWLYGDKGGSHWPANEILKSNNATRQHLNTQLVNREGGEAHAKECIAFADAVAHGKPSPVPAEESLDVITILDALYRSAESGRDIRLDWVRAGMPIPSEGTRRDTERGRSEGGPPFAPPPLRVPPSSFSLDLRSRLNETLLTADALRWQAGG